MAQVKTKTWGGVPAARVELILSDVLPLLRTIPLQHMTLDNMLYFLSTGALQLWVYGDFEAVLVTEIVHYPNYSVLVLKFGAGKMSRSAIDAGRAIVLPWAKRYGCTKVEVAGREGWGRVLGLPRQPPSFLGDLP